SRKAKVNVNGRSYSGIPGEMCSTCHNRGKRIGVSYLGLIESAYDTPWNSGESQSKLHGKRYHFIADDHHHNPENREENPKGSLFCQDCHTSADVHGNGNIGGTTFGEVEIECTDCHGTPEKYPWELPLGFGDEYESNIYAESRGVTYELTKIQQKFSVNYPPDSGYLLTARGNPFGNIIRKNEKVILHAASGLDFQIPLLADLNKNNSWKNSQKANTAMVQVDGHIKTMECYSCHASWAPQCYGCHVKVDYSREYSSVDWVKSGNMHFKNGETIESKKNSKPAFQPGKSFEGRTYMRWEDPVLGINGEGRIGPVIPGCQQITTVINGIGDTILTNHIWRTPPNMENSGTEGQRCIDMAPAQPHTISAKARDCVSCHTNPKTLGYGVGNEEFMTGYEKDIFTDMKDGSGVLISKKSTLQIAAIPELDFDLSQIITREGKQIATVGHHWPASGPLPNQIRQKMERVGVCISCHQNLPDGNIWISAVATSGELLGLTPHTDDDHSSLLNRDIRWAAFTRILFFPLVLLVLIMGWIIWKLKFKG
ncbi:MAG: hypothetical protein K8R53_05935, partial [Bacteroidales bacterium]|nr:hypothetical protein [Bacteroidales bacterium]